MYVDVIIPTYHPDEQFTELIDMLERQSVLPFQIIIINTQKEYFDEYQKKLDITKKYSNVRVYHVEKSDFDHARTRTIGAMKSSADYLLFLTMDAIPKDIHLIENLLKAMDDKNVAVSYARQLPRKGAVAEEIYAREFNYPDCSKLKSKEDIENLGIKTFFCSDVCALYRGDIFRQKGGFVDSAIFNEDMYYAADSIFAGYKIAYCADALVVHSHNLKPMELFKRNFDLGVSQADRPDLFENIRSESEGMKLVTGTIKYLIKNRQPLRIPYFCICCAFKLFGYKMGKNYKKMSHKRILSYTANKEYWLRLWEVDSKCVE